MEIKRTPELKGKDAVRFLKRISKNESKRATKKEIEKALKSAMSIGTMNVVVSIDKKNQMKGRKITGFIYLVSQIPLTSKNSYGRMLAIK